MRRYLKLLLACLTLLSIATVYGLVKHEFESLAKGAMYVGSDQCRHCHEAIHGAWQQSLHHQMMRPVADPDAVNADLTSDRLPFEPNEVVWVIGSRWQQQFMGHSEGRDTLLPGAWSQAKQQWQLNGWDGWQVPDPVVRCHGCHTVGLDLATGEFIEPGIGCESCHGPGEWHVATDGRSHLNVGVDADVCGQCHSRGMSADNQAFFPYQFRPGDKLDQHFEHLEADFLQNSSQWWGTGREKKRHQEYAAWSRGGHSQSLNHLLHSEAKNYGEPANECLKCHAGEAAIRGDDHGQWLEQVEHGITCAVCHNSHGELEKTRMGCESCHDQGAFHHQDQPLLAHIPCPPEAGVSCVDCHMPLTVKMGGEFVLRSHAPGITEPIDGARFNSPSSCANDACHTNNDVNELQQAFDHFYRQPEREIVRKQ